MGADETTRVRVTDKRVAHRPDDAPEVPAVPIAEAEEDPGSAEDPDRVIAERDEYLADLQRLKAEFDNYRKRVAREQTQSIEFAAEPLVRRMLEVLDEFELALVAAEQKPEFEKFLRGVEMVYAKLIEILKQEGLERIAAEGQAFDPMLHEALMQVPGGEPGDGEPVVADVLRAGYALKGRVIRPAGVKVRAG